MGEPIPDEPPGTCAEDCCDELPPTIFVHVRDYGECFGDCDATLNQDPENPCLFFGVGTCEFEDPIALIVTFCADETGMAAVTGMGGVYLCCGGCQAAGAHCSSFGCNGGRCYYTVTV